MDADPHAGNQRVNPSRSTRRAVLTGAAILAAYVAFTLLTFPPPFGSFRFLAINKDIYDTTTAMLASNWTRLLWPLEYEMNRIYWPTATLLPTYFAERFLGPLASYLLFSGTFIVTAYALAYRLTRSLEFAATLAFMFAFGTQINYVYTFGSLIPLYLMLTFGAINLSIVVLMLREELAPRRGMAAFTATLLLLALSAEWWINYAVAIGAACLFGILWAQRHGLRHVRQVGVRVVGMTAAVLLAYLLVRLQYPGQFFRAGEEEELLLTYSSPILMVEDFLTNLLTYLYMVLSNYLPSFLASSNSLTYLGPQVIIAEQHGYHAQYQQLVVMSHLFMWRFHAGVAVTLFVAAFALALRRAWRTPGWHHAIVSSLMIMVMTGFATHLLIKMRPYNVTAALGYKVTFSVAAFTILVSYLVMVTCTRLQSRRARFWLIGAVWGCVFVAALTRPGMLKTLLDQVGLWSFRDPLGQLLFWK